MNIQDYISSGIVESYVLGMATAAERQAFEERCTAHPELLEARIAFEKALEKQAMENAIAPPAFLRNKILDQRQPLAEPATVTRNISWWKYAAAAAVLLLLGSLWFNITLYQKNKSLKNEYAVSQGKMDDMKKDMEIIQSNPNIKMASMKGMPVSPNSYATIYWDTTSHDVYLLANNLPLPASDKQYQLWAIINSKPVDLGVFDVKKEKLLIQAKNAQGVEAFAITLEKKGGSPDGPRGDMYVMGKL